MRHVNTYFKILLLFFTVFFCGKTNAQVNGFAITDGSFPTAHNLGTSFPINVAFNWTSTTTSATVVIAYNNALVSYNSACQNSLPACMNIIDNGSAITIAMNNLSNCVNTTSISFNVCFQFKCPDSCVGVNKPSVFNGTITDNFNTTQSSSTTANGILPNTVTLSNTFSSFNQLTGEVTYRACFNNPGCFNIRNPVFNVALSPVLGMLTSAYSSNYTFTVAGNTFTPNTTLFSPNANSCIFYVIKLPCNTGLGQTLVSTVTMRGVNCGTPNSTIITSQAAPFTIPATPAAVSSISLGTSTSSSTFSHIISNTGNTPLNITATNYLPLVHLVSESQSSGQAGLGGSVRYFDCSLAPSATFTITGNATNSNVPVNARRLEHNIINLLPGNSVTITTNYSTASSCNGAAGVPPYRDSLVIVYNCAAPPTPCIPCGPGGTRTNLAVYNPSPAMACLSINNITGCKNIGDTISLCYSFRNIGDFPLNNGLLEVVLPVGLQYLAGSAAYTGFTPTQPTVTTATNVNFSLPSIPVSTTNTYTICLKAIVQTGAVGGSNAFSTFISGTGYSRRSFCSANFIVCAYAAIGVNKKVKGSLDGAYSMSGQGAPGSMVNYEITLRNTGTVPVNNLVVVDRIPAAGNLTILGSPTSASVPNQFPMQMLAAPANANYTATYTGIHNVCTGWTGTGTPCNSGTWSSTLASGGVKFTFAPGFTLAAGDTYVFTFQTVIPDTASNNLTDCNTAGFSAAPAGGGTLNPAESAPACIRVVNPCNTNVTPVFTVSSSCLGGNFSVTATSSEPSTTNHEWFLMRTNICGVTTDAATAGQVGSTQTTSSATFSINPSTYCYYIKHRIFIAGCYDTTIRIPINVPQASVAFNFEDVNGIPKTTFCLGENIYLDGTASTGENQYIIRILRRVTGSGAGFATYATFPNFPGAVGVINLSQAMLNLTPPHFFQAGYDYSVELTIINEANCVSKSAKASLTVKCCTDFINADFQLSVTPVSSATYNMASVLFNSYANASATHEWYVLSSPNQTGGPYTPVFSTTAASLTFIGAQYNLYYTVIHKVITTCGEVCSTVVQYQSHSRNVQRASSECCLAFQYWPNGAGTTPQEFSAEFDLDITSLGGGQYSIDLTPMADYSSNPNVTHEWYVLSSPNQTGGPFTAVAQSTVVNYSYSPASDGLYYFVIHKVKSPCGKVCYGQNICRNCRSTEACQFCGVIDCTILDEVWPACHPPVNLVNNCGRATLSWDAVGVAAGYELELSYNDPACCRSRNLPSIRTYTLTTNSYDLNEIRHPRYDCIRWRVRAICDKEETSAWSDWSCYSCGQIILEPEFPLIGRSNNNEVPVKEDADFTPQIFPNPNSGDMYLQMATKGELVLSVEVFNTQGVLIKTIPQSKYPDGKFSTRLNLGSSTPKGLYLVVFKTNFGTYNKKVVIN